jgi:hypothetical protein
VGEEIVDRDRALGRHQTVFGHFASRHPLRADILVCGLLEDGNLHVLEFGQVLGDFVGRIEEPLLDHHHRRHPEHGLRRRGHAKDRVFLHRPVVLDIHQAMGFEVDHLAAPRHHRHRSLDLSLVHVFLHHGVDLEQALARHAHILRRGCRNLPGRKRR